MNAPFDAVLIISFGGPQGPDDIRPFLANVLRGRRVSPERVEEVAHHYELFGGVSPITELTQRQADGLARAPGGGRAIRCPCTSGCATGIRSWPTRCTRCTSTARAARSVSLPRRSTRTRAASSTARTSLAARAELRARDGRRTSTSPTSAAGSTIRSSSRRTPSTCARRCERLPADVRGRGPADLHRAQHSGVDGGAVRDTASSCTDSARLVAAAAGVADWALVYQSRSGRPEDPWLEPDICDYLRQEHAPGLPPR